MTTIETRENQHRLGEKCIARPVLNLTLPALMGDNRGQSGSQDERSSTVDKGWKSNRAPSSIACSD